MTFGERARKEWENIKKLQQSTIIEKIELKNLSNIYIQKKINHIILEQNKDMIIFTIADYEKFLKALEKKVKK
jgi:Fe2+ or Zn2+ uptake regulation protein